MQTTRIISNISYNTPEHFCKTVYDLLNRHVIDWCYWIFHKADKDELKDHIHFVLKPSSRVDTASLRDAFNELDPSCPSKPLTCTMRWNFTSSMDDWLLYAVHDAGYLASKGQVRNYHYEYDDLCTTDPDALLEDWNNIDRMKYSRLSFLWDAVQAHTPFALLVQHGMIPISQRAQYEMQYKALTQLAVDDLAHRKESHEEG